MLTFPAGRFTGIAKHELGFSLNSTNRRRAGEPEQTVQRNSFL